jgi:hypothetical protein
MLERLEQQKTLTLNQWKIIATAGVGDMLDFFDFFLIGYVLAFILKDWQITDGQSAVILISAGLGAVPGAFFWGWMGDRIGRRKVFILTALNVALATGIMYFTPQQGGWIQGWIFLSFFRFFVGFGNAGLIAVDIPLVQEFVPSYKRGWVSGLTTTLLPAGNILGAVSGAFLAPIIRLAPAVSGGFDPGSPRPDDPILDPGIAAFPDAHGADGGGTQIARLGVAMRPPGDRAAERHRPGGKDAVARIVQISPQHGGGVHGRVEPDRRRRHPDVDHRALCDGAQGHPGRSVLSDDLGRHPRRGRTARCLLDVGCPGAAYVGLPHRHGRPWPDTGTMSISARFRCFSC